MKTGSSSFDLNTPRKKLRPFAPSSQKDKANKRAAEGTFGDTAALDEAKDALLSAVESGSLRQGYSEDGIAMDEELPPNIINMDGEPEAQARTTVNKYVPSVDISKIPKELTRNQSAERQVGDTDRGLRISRSQSSNIRNDNIESEDMSKRSKKSKKQKKIILIFSIFGIIVLMLASAFAWYKIQLQPAGTDPDDCNDQQCISFAIAEGEHSMQIAKNLESKGIIKSAFAFNIYLKLEAPNSLLKSGNYALARSLSVPEVVARLNKGANAETKNITFLPGGTIADAKKVLLNAGYSESEIDIAFTKQYDLPLFDGRPKDSNIEGYIYGDTYEVYVNASVEQILTTKVFPEMQAFVDKNELVEHFRKLGFSLYGGITLASVVYGESGTLPDEMPAVARVFLNRLASDIPLGSDAVIAYRANQLNPNRDKSDLSGLETIQCPWHSRRCKGLPPSPISSPSAAALKATAEPADNDYYYFLTGDDFKMYYAKDEKTHNENIQKYCRELCRIM